MNEAGDQASKYREQYGSFFLVNTRQWGVILVAIRWGLRYGVVIVTVIVTAQPLVAEVAQDQEARPRQRDGALAGQAEKTVTEEIGQDDEHEADRPVEDDAAIPMRATPQAKRDQAGRDDKPQQQGVKGGIAQERCGEDGEGDDGNRDQKAMHRARRRDQNCHLVSKGLCVL